MYSSFRNLCERLLRIPTEPEPPPGDEAKTQVFRAAPNYYKYLIAMWALQSAASFLLVLFLFIGPMVALFAGHSQGGKGWIAPILIIEGLVAVVVLVGALFRLALVRLDFEKRWYVVTDRSLRVREGIAQVREATVTFANIQNISISQGPVQRVLGIADLRVDTAGGGAVVKGQRGMYSLHTVWFRGVANANEIRELMQQRLRQLKDSGLGDHEEMMSQPTKADSPDLVAALREVAAEAGALRAAVARRAPSGIS